jgi:hypothetical protein
MPRPTLPPAYLLPVALAIGCAASPARPIRQARGEPDVRNPPELTESADKAEQPRAETKPMPMPMPAPGGPEAATAEAKGPTVPVRVSLDGRAAAFEAATGHWVVPGTVSGSPMFRFDLEPSAGRFERMLIVLWEYRGGRPDPETEVRILGMADLPPGRAFPLDRPAAAEGVGAVRIRTKGGDSAETVPLRPGTTYLAWLQVQTSARREGSPWPWPYLRFTVAAEPAP